MEATDITTRQQIADMQAQRLPDTARRVSLHIRPKRALDEAALQDALELAAAEVLESGRELAEMPDAEKRAILTRCYEHCRERNRVFMRVWEEAGGVRQ